MHGVFAQDSDAQRSQQGCGRALACDIANRNCETAIAVKEEIIEITPYLLGRKVVRGKIDPVHLRYCLWKQKILHFPGVLQVRRFTDASGMVADAIFDESRGWPEGPRAIVDPMDFTRQKKIPADAAAEDLLVPVMRAGKPVYTPPPLAAVRARALAQVAGLPGGVKRFLNPHQYPVGLEPSLHELKTRLVLEARGAVVR